MYRTVSALSRSVFRPALSRGSVPSGVRTFATEAEDGLLSLSLLLPHKPIFQNRKVRLVVIPAQSGMMGVLKNHVPTIAPLKPGVVTVEESGKQEKFFVSGGFAFVNPDKTCQITAVEAVPVDQIDPDAARSGLTHYTQEYAKAQGDEDKAKARIGLEVHQQLVYAIGQ